MAKAKTEAETPQYYTVVHTGVGPFKAGEVVSADRFGPDAQIDRLIRKGAIAETSPPEHVVGKPWLSSAFVNSTGVVDRHGLDRPDIAARSDEQILSPEDRASLVEEAEAAEAAAAEESVEEVPPADETGDEEAAPAARRRRKS